MNDELSLINFVRVVYRGKWILLLCVTAAVGGTIFWASTTTARYTAMMTVAPILREQSPRFGGEIAALRQLTAIAGVNLGRTGATTRFQNFITLLNSYPIGKILTENYDLNRKLAVAKWDPVGRIWVRPNGILNRVKYKLNEYLGLPGWVPPTVHSFLDYLNQRLTIDRVQDAGFFEVKFEHEDPEVAETVLKILHKEADAFLRNKAYTRTTQEIEFLEQRISDVAIQEHRQALVALLSGLEQELLVIGPDLPFAADIIQPPVANKVPTYPRPMLFLVIAALGGVFVGTILAFVYDQMRPPKSAASTPPERVKLV